MAKKTKTSAGKSVEALRHGEAKRRNIPTAEYQSVIQKEAERPLVAQIATLTSGGSTGAYLAGVVDSVLWFAKDLERTKFRALFSTKELGGDGAEKYNRVRLPNLDSRPLSSDERIGESELPTGARVYRRDNLTTSSPTRVRGSSRRPR